MAKNQIDHLMYAVKNLDEGIERFHELTGVKAVYGGAHENMGTCNALLSLGNRQYIELIAPDPNQTLQDNLGSVLRDADRDGLRSWAIATTSLPDLAVELTDFFPGNVIDMTRVTKDGERLQWQLMFLKGSVNLPFFIDWQHSPHPSLSTPQGCSLIDVTVSSDTPEKMNTLKTVLGLDFSVVDGENSLTARIQTPNGAVTLTPWQPKSPE
jgi:hypothetical protein